VTGGSRGIGKACVAAFAQAGCLVAFTYSKSAKEAEALAAQTGAAGCLAVKADSRDYAQCREVVETALTKFGRLDILVNNAGITRDKALMMMTQEDFTDVIATNLGGTFNMSRAVITTFLKQKNGCIINISSVSGLVGIARQTNYSASKAGIIGFTRSLAKETAAYGVRVNAVCPGYTDTDMTAALRDDVKKQILETIPMKRMAKPEEVAGLCLFLACDSGAYITGEAIRIDGGLTV